MKKTHLTIKTLCLVIGLIFFSTTTNSQQTVASLEKTFSGISNLIIEGYYCNVDVNGSAAASEVHLDGKIDSRDHFYLNIHESVSGSTLKIWVDIPDGNSSNTTGQLTLSVPSRIKLDIKNTNGNVSIQNVSSNDYKVKTTLGRITASNVNANLNVESASGSAIISKLSGNLVITTKLGNHVIKNVTGNIDVNCPNGSITANDVKGIVNTKTTRGPQTITNVTGSLNLESIEGDLTLTNISGNVSATTESGNIQIESTTGALKLKTIIGNQRGKSNRLTGNSTFISKSGSINMQLLNTKEQLSFRLTATSGKLSAKGSMGRRNLVVDNGGIQVLGETTAGSQNFY